jgi:hypothetical protein
MSSRPSQLPGRDRSLMRNLRPAVSRIDETVLVEDDYPQRFEDAYPQRSADTASAPARGSRHGPDGQSADGCFG